MELLLISRGPNTWNHDGSWGSFLLAVSWICVRYASLVLDLDVNRVGTILVELHEVKRGVARLRKRIHSDVSVLHGALTVVDDARTAPWSRIGIMR